MGLHEPHYKKALSCYERRRGISHPLRQPITIKTQGMTLSTNVSVNTPMNTPMSTPMKMLADNRWFLDNLAGLNWA